MNVSGSIASLEQAGAARRARRTRNDHRRRLQPQSGDRMNSLGRKPQVSVATS